VGDSLTRSDLYNKFPSPEMEFLRHVRNALSHGNSFHFIRRSTQQEPVRPASFMGFVLTSALDNTLIWDLLWPADLLELLDSIEIYLRRV
jgi:hypothetical protein